MQEIHDYTKRYFGHDYTVMNIYDNGQTIRLAGWGIGLKNEDYILLCGKEKESTRYQLFDVTYQTNPSDMFFAKGVFAPRQNVERS